MYSWHFQENSESKPSILMQICGDSATCLELKTSSAWCTYLWNLPWMRLKYFTHTTKNLINSQANNSSLLEYLAPISMFLIHRLDKKEPPSSSSTELLRSLSFWRSSTQWLRNDSSSKTGWWTTQNSARHHHPILDKFVLNVRPVIKRLWWNVARFLSVLG